jgi:GAF domain-containing protein/HAMP domain-containing protein
MNRQNFLSLPIGGKILLALATAALLPLVLLALLTFSATTTITLETLESFLSASGQQQRQAIESDFGSALLLVEDFVDDPFHQSVMTAPLVEILQQNTFSRTREDRVQELFEANLFTSPYFTSAWLQTPPRGADNESIILATSVVPRGDLPFSRTFQEEGRSQIISIGEALAEQGTGDTRALAYTQRETSSGDIEPHIELVQLLYDSVDGSRTLVGYLVIDLNLDAIIRSNLGSEQGQFEPYSFVVPAPGQFITTPETRANGLVDTNSDAVTRVQTEEASGLAVYEVGPEDARREVLGFFTPLTIEEETFSLVTELNTSVIDEQILSRAGGIGFPLVVGGVALVGVLALLLNTLIVSPLDDLREAIRGITRGRFDLPLSSTNRRDEIGAVTSAFNEMRQQLQALTEDMNRRLQERTRDVRVTQDIGRTVTAERDLQQLMNRVVDLIVENFPAIYHAQIFLIDSDEAYAVLRASTGEPGQQLLQRGHKLAVGSISVIGQVTEQGRYLVARDAAESDVHKKNEFLPETLTELAIPLKLGSKIIGALDVQSRQRNSFDDDQISALQTLADQITIAIENARLYEESERLLSDLERDRSTGTRYAWQQYLNQQRQAGLQTLSGQQTDYDFSAIRRAVMQSAQPVIGEPTARSTIPFGVPIVLRNQTLGVIECEVPEKEFTYDRVLLAEELVNRLAISLENARLFQESQEATERERIVNEISARLTGQTEIQSIIQTAIEEVGQALRTPQVAIRLQLDNGNSNGSRSRPDAPESTDSNPS